MDNELMTPEMIDCLRPNESDRSARAKLMRHALRQIDWQVKRIAELEAEVADDDATAEMRRERTIEASREWQQATGNPDVWPDLGTLIDWLRGARDRLRAALEKYSGRANWEAHNIGLEPDTETIYIWAGFEDEPWKIARAALPATGEEGIYPLEDVAALTTDRAYFSCSWAI